MNFCNSLATIIQLTTEGIGLSLLAPGLLQSEIKRGLLRTVPVTRLAPKNRYFVAYSTGDMSPAIGAVSAIATGLVAQYQDSASLPRFCDRKRPVTLAAGLDVMFPD